MSLSRSRPTHLRGTLARVAGTGFLVAALLLGGCGAAGSASFPLPRSAEAAVATAPVPEVRRAPAAAALAATCEAIGRQPGENAVPQQQRAASGVQARYNEDTNTIEVRRGQAVTLPALSRALGRPGALRELSPGEWLLAANLQVAEGAEVTIAAPEVRRLKLRSDARGFVWIKTIGGTLRIDGACVTSWDTTRNDVDRNYDDGRSFILARSGATLTVNAAELSYLGYDANESYGVAWRLKGTSGTITNTTLGYNFYGLYAYQVAGLVVRGNDVHHSVHYGIDPHTRSNKLVIEDNSSHHNGKHGIILAEGCFDSIVRNNTSYSNAMHGIVLYHGAHNNLVEGNVVYDNGLEGININDSHENTIRQNTVYSNAKAGIGVGQSAEDNTVAGNTVFENREDGIALYSEARATLLRANIVRDNVRYGIYVKSAENEIAGEHQISGNRIGVYLNVSPAPVVSLETNRIYDNREDDLRITAP